MADPALLAEAYKRGILPPDKAEAYEEALRRGLVNDPGSLALADARRRAKNTPGQVRAINAGGTFGLADEVDAAGAALETGAHNLLAKTGLVKPSGYSMGQARDAVMQAEQEQSNAFRKDHPAQDIGFDLVGAVANPLNRLGAKYIAAAAKPVQAVARATAVGAGTGAAYGAGSGEGAAGRAKGAVAGAGVGATTGMLLQGAGNALAGRAATAATQAASPARELAKRGIQLTPGQMAGGTAKRLEDAMTSVPLTGDAIRNAQRRGIESFDTEAINRVLAPIGQRLPDGARVGRDGVKLAHQAVSDAYDKALSGVTVAADDQFLKDVSAVSALKLKGSAADEVGTAVEDLADSFKNPIGGRDLKELDESLGIAIRNAPHGPVGRAQQRALIQLQDALDGLLERTAPDAAAGKKAADAAFAHLVRVEGAAGSVGARDGIFSPAQLQSAVRAADKGARKSKFARGDALMQDLSDPALSVLPQSVPDSGTAIRSLMTAPPQALLASVATSVPATVLYSRPVMAALNRLYLAGNPGQVEAAVSQLQLMAARTPALQPLYQETLRVLRGDPANEHSATPWLQPQTRPTR